MAWAFGAVIASTFIIKKFREVGYSTVTKLVESIYDEKTGIIMTLAMILIQCTIIALQYIAGGSILTSLLPDVFTMKATTFFSFLIFMLVGFVGSILASLLPDVFTMKTATFFSFLIFMLVGFVGGMRSASISNILNISLIYIGVIVSSVVVLFNQGGWESAKVMAVNTLEVPYISLTSGMGVAAIVAWMIVMCGTTNSLQGVIQIGLTSKDDKSTVNGFRIGALIMVPIGFMCAMIGIASKALILGVEATLALPKIILSLSPVIAGLTLLGIYKMKIEIIV